MSSIMFRLGREVKVFTKPQVDSAWRQVISLIVWATQDTHILIEVQSLLTKCEYRGLVSVVMHRLMLSGLSSSSLSFLHRPFIGLRSMDIWMFFTGSDTST